MPITITTMICIFLGLVALLQVVIFCAISAISDKLKDIEERWHESQAFLEDIEFNTHSTAIAVKSIKNPLNTTVVNKNDID